MAMMHWLHIAMGRGRRLVAYATNELPTVVGDRVEADLLLCSACRREVEEYRLVSRMLQMSARAALTPKDAAAFWSGVETRIQRGEVGTSRPARPALRELFWDHPRLSLISGVAAVILVLDLTLGPLGLWGPGVVSNGVEVLSVEAGDDAPVMVFQAPGSKLKVIWVFEKPSPS
jgi:hypothetical protein